MWIYTSYLSRRQPISHVQTPNHDQLRRLYAETPPAVGGLYNTLSGQAFVTTGANRGHNNSADLVLIRKAVAGSKKEESKMSNRSNFPFGHTKIE